MLTRVPRRFRYLAIAIVAASCLVGLSARGMAGTRAQAAPVPYTTQLATTGPLTDGLYQPTSPVDHTNESQRRRAGRLPDDGPGGRAEPYPGHTPG